MKLTVAVITGRAEPHLDWLLESLAPQVDTSDDIQVLVVDLRGRTPYELGAHPRYGHWDASDLRVVTPKPNVWQGEHRLTSCDWWAKSSSINTALVLCETDHIAFVDDCCRLGPRWLETVRRGERERASVIAGSYEKIERGTVTHDGRRLSQPGGKVNCGGNWLYGCTYALPLEWALEVNGAEEGCDGMGGEDYIFGLMLANAGHRIDFVPAMMITQERPEPSGATAAGGSVPLKRTDKGVSPNDKSHAALHRFGGRKRTEFTPDLRELRVALRTGDGFPMPSIETDWYDGQPIKEM